MTKPQPRRLAPQHTLSKADLGADSPRAKSTAVAVEPAKKKGTRERCGVAVASGFPSATKQGWRDPCSRRRRLRPVTACFLYPSVTLRCLCLTLSVSLSLLLTPSPHLPVVRFTKDELLAMRKPNSKILESMAEMSTEIVSEQALDPVCWEPFDQDEVMRLWQASIQQARRQAAAAESGGAVGPKKNRQKGELGCHIRAFASLPRICLRRFDDRLTLLSPTLHKQTRKKTRSGLGGPKTQKSRCGTTFPAQGASGAASSSWQTLLPRRTSSAEKPRTLAWQIWTPSWRRTILWRRCFGTKTGRTATLARATKRAPCQSGPMTTLSTRALPGAVRLARTTCSFSPWSRSRAQRQRSRGTSCWGRSISRA